MSKPDDPDYEFNKSVLIMIARKALKGIKYTYNDEVYTVYSLQFPSFYAVSETLAEAEASFVRMIVDNHHDDPTNLLCCACYKKYNSCKCFPIQADNAGYSSYS